jgi:hypothetical protein
MSDIRWGWLLGSAAVGAALGLLMSSGDARRNPYNGRKKRKVKRQNPADFTDYDLDPSDADFDDKLKAKLEELEKEGVDAKKLAKDIKDSPDDQALKQEFELKKTGYATLFSQASSSKAAVTGKEGEMLREIVKEKEGAKESGGKIDNIRRKYGLKYATELEAKKAADPEYQKFVVERDKLIQDTAAARIEKDEAEKAWDDFQSDVAKKIRQADRVLSELEQLKYERALEIDEEEDREFEKNKHYAQKALRHLEGHNPHHKVHSAPKRRVRNNK